MRTETSSTGARFGLVTAAHHFLSDGIPLRHPESTEALATFVAAAVTCRLPPGDADAVLLRTLSVLNPYTGGRLPSLVDRYLARRQDGSDSRPVTCFGECVRDVIRYRGIGNLLVQKAIAIVEDRYGDSELRQAAVAQELGVTPGVLSVAFKDQTSVTFTEYRQALRLDRAATLLTTTDKSIKEIWVLVGYNHAINFDHDFKYRFGSTPSEYRARAIRSATSPNPRPAARSSAEPETDERPAARGTVLIVDDDEGTRDTIAAYLNKMLGFKVVTAATGEAGLREAARVKPQTILLDYQLPDIDGIKCLRALSRQDWRSRRPVVILFTADWSIEDHANEIHALGATILSKLCDLEDVGRAVATSRHGTIHTFSLDSCRARGRTITMTALRRPGFGDVERNLRRNGIIEIEPQPLSVKLERRGRLLVATPAAKVPTLRTTVVERTRRRLPTLRS